MLAARDRYCACVLSARRDTAALHCTAAVSRRPLAGLGGLWSPDSEVSSSLLWVLRRCALTYLAPQENYCQEISQALCAAFGRETEGAAWSVNFLLDQVLSNLAHCGGEPGVVEDTVLLLVGLAEIREKCRAVLGSPGLQQLVAVAHGSQEAALLARRRLTWAGQGARAGGGRAGGQGGAGGALGPGEGQYVVQCRAVQSNTV